MKQPGPVAFRRRRGHQPHQAEARGAAVPRGPRGAGSALFAVPTALGEPGERGQPRLDLAAGLGGPQHTNDYGGYGG